MACNYVNLIVAWDFSVQLTVLILAAWALGSASFFGVLGLANGDGRIRRGGGNPAAEKEREPALSAIPRKSLLEPDGASSARPKRA